MQVRPIRKVLIANRGEIALRVMRTCREIGIATVAVYSEADRAMPHVSFADEAYCIGPAPARESYLVAEKIISAALGAGADAIHPGYGFLSENAEFARRVIEAGLAFVGPPPESIRAMGDKVEARRIVGSAGVPVVPGTEEPVRSPADVSSFIRAHGVPVIIKAAGGGGGKGMRIIGSEGEIAQALETARSEARAAFGDERVYVEKYLESPRHIEFQILADQFGNTIHLGERECSIQRRHQKIVEESPSAVVGEELRRRMGETAVRAARSCGYQNAGTVEFLLDGSGKFYFLEMNTRLQVEHPVTEMRTGLDLVACQFRIAAGEALAIRQDEVRFTGHAIECRICAEDVENDFFPSTGMIAHLRPAQGPGVREDRGIDEGGEVSVYYDPMIAKLIVLAPTRREAIEKMRRALNEYEILGVKTNIPVCRFVMEHPLFRAGTFDTHFLREHFRSADLPRASEDDLIAAALLCAQMEQGTLVPMSDNPANAAAAARKYVDGSGAQSLRGWKRLRFDSMR